jgi:hypothetical protein
LVPALRAVAVVGSFAEHVTCPTRVVLNFALRELVAQLGVLAGERVDRSREVVPFFVDRGGVAEFAGERRALCERAFELVLGAGEHRGESGAIDEVRILVSPEAAAHDAVDAPALRAGMSRAN